MSHDERGSVSIELAILAPVVLMMLGLVVMAGRIAEVEAAILDAADQAARAATLVADPATARAEGERTARANLTTQEVACSSVAVDVDVSRFARGGDVAVEVACEVDLSDLSFAGLPGTRRVSATSVEVIDVWRGGP